MSLTLPISSSIYTCLGALTLTAWLPAQESPVSNADRAQMPNFLWIVSEDNSPHTVGAYGDPLARTPHLDQLARDGIVYERAYAAAPVCAPSRSSIITGRYASSMGTQHMRSQRPLPEGVRAFPEFLRQAGYYTSNNVKTDYNTSTNLVAAAWDESSTSAHWRNRRPGQPFFAIFNTTLSHESGLHSRRPLVTDPARVRVPAYLPDTPDVRADLAQYYDNVARADEALGRILEQLAKDGLAEDTIVFYYSDHGGAVSRSKRFAFESGTHVPLIVHFPGKFRHLAPAGPGSRTDELVNLIDLAPTLLSLAGVPLPAQFQGRAFAGPARTAAPSFTFMFRDRMDERYDLARAVTDGRFRYIRNYYPNQPWGQKIEYLWRQASMRDWSDLHRQGRLNADQRRFFEPKPAEELFDSETDPDNVRNLAADPAFLPRLERLRGALRSHLLAIRDTGFMPEPMMIALAGDRSPATVATDDREYPLDRILTLLDAAQLSGQPDPALLRPALRAPEPTVRYWAGVAAQDENLAAAELEPLLTDAQPTVRLAAAEVLLRKQNHAGAWDAIGKIVKNPDRPEDRLFALNLLARLDAALPAGLQAEVVQQAALRQSDDRDTNIRHAAQSVIGHQ